MAFAIGVIMFLGDDYVISSLHHLAVFFAPQSQLANNLISGAFFIQIGAILIIISGVIMFFVGKKRVSPSPKA